ncbi:hypothetical protein KIPB_000021 [Kipferlia bialata]|uniref:Uncharacterized protein n=1 Tax=Kipferlia bialata TaxID=797122 RepID=A0A9K3GE15_9EUKA|nr:hypothetical protein KIPB_000021 [Kipferlia bialata]|eukprot:g21.t1
MDISQIALVSSISTEHSSSILDVEPDYYGQRIATASSDGSVRVFATGDGSPDLVCQLTHHKGPVYRVAFSHPSHDGGLLATAGEDNTVCILKETSPGTFSVLHSVTYGAVTCIAWLKVGPVARLAVACASGHVHVLSAVQDSPSGLAFEETCQWVADVRGCLSVDWEQSPLSPDFPRLVTSGLARQISVWKLLPEPTLVASMGPQTAAKQGVPFHSSPVHSVRWSPSLTASSSVIASASDDLLLVWRAGRDGLTWTAEKMRSVDETKGGIHRVAWSITGTMLAVTRAIGEAELIRIEFDGQ